MSDHPTLPFDEPEEWRPVLGWEYRYEVSDLGRVRTLYYQRRYQLISAIVRWGGYLSVILYADGSATTRSVHSLVAEAFIGPCPEGALVRHGPGGHLDNRAVNLSYGNFSQNALDRYRDGSMILGEQHHEAKLTDTKVQAIRARRVAGERAVLLAAEYGVSRHTIDDVVNRKTWRHVA